MSNKKITDLTELTTPTTDDVFPVVDIATNTTRKVQLGNLPTSTAVTTALATKQDTLVSGTNIKTLNNTSLLGSGNINVVASPSGVAGAIQFSDGSAFASDATNFFWNNTTKRLGIATNAPTTALDVNGSIRAGVNLTVVGEIQNPTVGVVNINGELRVASPNVSIGLTSYPARLAVRGSGSTSATTSLLVQNSAGTQALKVSDNTYTQVTRLYLQDSNDFFYAPAGNPIIADGFHGFRVQRSTGSTQTMFEVSDLYNTTGGLLMNVKNQLFANMLCVNYLGNVGVGVASPTARTHIQGSGSTSATTSLLVQNSSGTELLKVQDDGSTSMGTGNAKFISLNSSNANFIRAATTYLDSPSGYFGSFVYNGFQIGNGSSAPNASAIIDATSTTQGFLPPRMTTTQKNAIATPAAGLVVYDSTTNKLCCYNGSTWNDLF